MNVVKVTKMGKVMLDSCQTYQSNMVNLQDSDWGIEVAVAPGKSLFDPPFARQNLLHKNKEYNN